MQSYFTEIYNFNDTIILYYFIQNVNDFIYKLNLYINNNNNKVVSNNVYIITNHYTENINLDFIKNKNINLLKTNINFNLFFKLHELKHNYLYKNKIKDTFKIKEYVNKIVAPLDNKTKSRINDFNQNRIDLELNGYLDIDKRFSSIKELDTENKIYKEIIDYKSIESIDDYAKLFEDINIFLTKNINCFKDGLINFKDLANTYIFKQTSLIYNSCIENNVTLTDVYYINKQFYDKNKNPIELKEFNDDFEYTEFKNHFEKKIFSDPNFNIQKIQPYQIIDEEVMYLDYIYGFYNFGEFWDVIKRLLVSSNKNLPLFHLTHNRITNINYYFDKLNFKFPTKYQKQENSGKLYYFNKINIPCVTNVGCRGLIDISFTYQFNKLFNNSVILPNKTYNIYLARGKYGRSLIDEEKIIETLKTKHEFIVLDGTETLKDTMHYFTNAKIIFGSHGSLIKNMIWCKKNPVLIELCPPTRANLDFYSNAFSLGFFNFFILSECNDKEEIILSEQQIKNLYELINILNK